MTTYQKKCARKAVLAARGHNRHLAFKWTARCRRIGEFRKLEEDRMAHYYAKEVSLA